MLQQIGKESGMLYIFVDALDVMLKGGLGRKVAFMINAKILLKLLTTFHQNHYLCRIV